MRRVKSFWDAVPPRHARAPGQLQPAQPVGTAGEAGAPDPHRLWQLGANWGKALPGHKLQGTACRGRGPLGRGFSGRHEAAGKLRPFQGQACNKACSRSTVPWYARKRKQLCPAQRRREPLLACPTGGGLVQHDSKQAAAVQQHRLLAAQAHLVRRNKLRNKQRHRDSDEGRE